MNIALIGVVLFFVGVLFFIYNLFKQNNKPNFIADIFEDRADGSQVLLFVNAGIKIIKKKGEIEKWKIVKSNIPPFQPKGKDVLYPYLKEGKDKAYLLRDKDGNFHACNLKVIAGQVVLIPSFKDQMEFVITEHEEKSKIKAKKSSLEQWTPVIGFVIAGLVFFCAIFFGYQHLEKKSGQIETEGNLAIQKIDSKVAEYLGTFDKANYIVQRDAELQRTANWTETKVGG
jgi:hypothetical protein